MREVGNNYGTKKRRIYGNPHRVFSILIHRREFSEGEPDEHTNTTRCAGCVDRDRLIHGCSKGHTFDLWPQFPHDSVQQLVGSSGW